MSKLAFDDVSIDVSGCSGLLQRPCTSRCALTPFHPCMCGVWFSSPRLQLARVLFPLPFEDRRDSLNDSVRAEFVGEVGSRLQATVKYSTTVSPTLLHMAIMVKRSDGVAGYCRVWLSPLCDAAELVQDPARPDDPTAQLLRFEVRDHALQHNGVTVMVRACCYRVGGSRPDG